MLDTSQKAPILKDDNAPLSSNAYTATSSNPAIANVSVASLKLYVEGIAPGTATITATRTSDGQSDELEVTVVEAPFTIHLGSPIAR